MNSTNPASLVFFRVLADKGGNPSGLLIHVGPGDTTGLLSLFENEHFSALSGQMRSFYPASLDPPLAAALDAAGWSQLVQGTLLREDEQLVKDSMPEGTLLIDGDWCMAPPPKPTGAQAASRALSLQLAQLVAADAHTHDIEALLRKDPTLSYHLLRLVNSLGMGVGRRISSFSQAILILGRQQLRRWVNLMLFAARTGDMRSGMLLARVAVRGRLLEQIARSRGMDKNNQDQAFIAGMFSLLGVLFGMSLGEVLAPLSMSEVVHDALLEHKGELGTMLRLCEAIEAGDFDKTAGLLDTLQVERGDFNLAMAEASHWMLGAVDGKPGGSHA